MTKLEECPHKSCFLSTSVVVHNLVLKQCNLYAKSLWLALFAWNTHGNFSVQQQPLCHSLWGDVIHLRVTCSSGCSWRIFKIRLLLLFKGKWSRQQVCNYFSYFQKILFLYYLLHVLWRWKSFEVSFLAIINSLCFKPCCFILEPSLHWMLIKTNCKNGKQAVVFCLSCFVFLWFSLCFSLFLFT